MKKVFKSRGIKISLILLTLGLVFLIIQNTFYGYIDENNVLRDSIFLPLGIMLSILGGISFIVSLTWGLLNKLKS